MKKFRALLKKELKELITLQMVLPLIIGSLVFAMLGNIIGSETKKMDEPKKIFVVDNDGSDASRLVITALENSNFIPEVISGTKDEAIKKAGSSDISLVLMIDEGFEEGINDLNKQEIKTYTIVENFSITAGASSAKVGATINAINNYLGNELIKQYSGGLDPDIIKYPVISIDNTIIGEKSAVISPSEVTSFIMSQTLFIPIVMFIIIIFSSQMIGVSVASEKENKTLETLLSTPVSRLTLVTTKMLAAAVAALIMASVYMLGFSYYMEGLTGGNLSAEESSRGAISQLGLSIGTTGYIMLGISLFLSILIALAIAMILGAFAEDVKKVQGLLAPIIFLIMIPYLFSMFIDIPNSSIFIRLIVYIIPFSHTFLAAPNIFLQNYNVIYMGAAYQFVVFMILAVIATRIFSSDKILTLKLNFGKKKS